MASKEFEQALEILNWEEHNSGDKILINAFENVVAFTLNGRNVKLFLILTEKRK